MIGMIRSELRDTGVVSRAELGLVGVFSVLGGVGRGEGEGRVLLGERGEESRWIGIILSFPCSSGIRTLQLDCFSCSLNSGRRSLNTAGTFNGFTSLGFSEDFSVE